MSIKTGTEAFWNYLMKKMEKYFETMDYTRVIHTYNHIPQTGALENFVIPPIIHKLVSHINDRYEELTEDRRNELEEELTEWKDGFVVVENKNNELRQELNEIAYEDKQANDIEELLKEAGKELKTVIEENIIKAIKKLDVEKGYEIMKELHLEEEER